MIIPRLFVDLDGVLADFDKHFEDCFGVRPNQDTYEPKGMWNMIRAHGSFYRDLPPMVDALKFWNALRLCYLHPVILTGIPASILDVETQKRAWVREHLGEHVQVICTYSRLKFKYGKKGDVLIDDRLKYASLWQDMGGIFIHHTDNEQTLSHVRTIYNCK